MKGLIEAEGENGFRRNFHLAPAGEDLGGSAGGGSRGGSDCGSPSPSGNGAEERAEDGSSADHSGGAAISAEAFAGGALDVLGTDVVLSAGDGDGIEIESKLGGPQATGG